MATKETKKAVAVEAEAPEVKVPEVKEEKTIEPYGPEDLVEIPPLFYDKDKYSAPVRVGVNGRMYLIPRGKSGIRVPRVVAEILQQSEYQKQLAGTYMASIEGVRNMGNY